MFLELKAVEFEPEFAGKLNFYLNAVDGELKHEQDAPTIGILLCKGKDKTVINKLFAPEFRNRLDAIVSFSKLEPLVVEKVVEKLIVELQEQLAEKKVSIKLSNEARTWLATNGYDPDFGARPLRRLIMKEIGDVMTEEILFGELTRGGEASVGLKDDKLTFAYTK